MPDDSRVQHDQDDLEGLPRETIEQVEASIKRGLADVKAGRTIDGALLLRRLRARIDESRARHQELHGPSER